MADAATLPEDVLAQAAVRVGVLCGVGLVFFGVALALLVLQPAPDREGLGMIPVAVSGLFSSAVAFGVIRFGGLADKDRLSLGLLYHVAMGFQIAVLELPRVSGEGVLLNGLSSLAVWQLLFAGLVPVSRRHLTAAALAIATAVPVTAAIAGMLGRVIDSGAVVVSTLPVLVAGGVGVAIGRVVYDLTQKVQEARDVGSYRLVRKLGEGGMGEVWTAEHRLLARPAAVKLIKADVLDQLAQEGDTATREDPRVLFEREAGVIANLRSPHTVELYDYGVRDDGVFFYVMELLDGFDLHVLVMKFGPLPVSRVLHVLQGICLSLAEAHDAGLVHRDMKPANVFLCELGTSADVVKVLDFGLVLTQEAPRSEEPETEVTGTPWTMSPEVARGLSATPGSDIYAVGCIAWWLLAGRMPFESESIHQLLFSHANLPVPNLAGMSAQPIPAALEALVVRCLAKAGEERPSARDLLREIEGIEGFGAWTSLDAETFWRGARP
ncbi:MAG: serine/threonine protein kinase [Deltaproteobacteria bacterium]|nr:serine/threonine protein kinase [Deltaproteobacteria bacterium]